MKRLVLLLLAITLAAGSITVYADSSVSSDSIQLSDYLSDAGEKATISSVQINKTAALKGETVTFTIKTSKNAGFLKMFTEDGKLYKTWKASGNSTVSGNVKTWKISLSFSGTGKRNISFKAGTTEQNLSAEKKVSFTIENIGVNSATAGQKKHTERNKSDIYS